MSGGKAEGANKMQIRWAISRLRKICVLWDTRLDHIDKEYILRRIRDREPAIFYRIAQEREL